MRPKTTKSRPLKWIVSSFSERFLRCRQKRQIWDLWNGLSVFFLRVFWDAVKNDKDGTFEMDCQYFFWAFFEMRAKTTKMRLLNWIVSNFSHCFLRCGQKRQRRGLWNGLSVVFLNVFWDAGKNDKYETFEMDCQYFFWGFFEMRVKTTKTRPLKWIVSNFSERFLRCGQKRQKWDLWNWLSVIFLSVFRDAGKNDKDETFEMDCQ